MKINKYYMMACAAWLCAATSCDNADYSVIDNAIYLQEASNTASTYGKVTVEGDVTHTDLTVRVGQPLNEDVTGSLELDASLLDAYNQTFSTSYEVLPSKYLSYEESFKIKKGETLAEKTAFSIKAYSNNNGELYAIPVRLKVHSGNIATIGDSQSYIILLDKALKQPVPVMDQRNKASTGKDMNLTTAEWSIEAWVWMDGFAINNQAIINSGSGKAGRANEIYIRFGDAPIPYNSLQIKTMGSQVNTVTLFEPNKWYHLTITYDAGGLVTIYVNGEKDVTLQTKGGMVNFDRMELVTSGSWFRNTCKMGQLRLWKKAITPSQIKSNMYLGINPKNPDLMGYWRLDEGKGNVFKDATPNGFDMTVEGTLKWEADVNFK
ncbi:MAG: DUF1735 and LamG domain-containing protein [Bacteroides heparinolyticus]|nr:DUF1735 and LamG domain-containing protein [Bacteroides heparinolyticus]